MAAESDELSVRVEKMVAEVLSNKKNVATLPPAAAASAEGDASRSTMSLTFKLSLTICCLRS